MDNYTISQWCLFFYLYSFIGWVWESAYVSVHQKRFVNRGFLKGPFLPIYGSGALCVLAAVLPVREDPVKTFLVGMLAATVLEYITGAFMERIFRIRYWDYTGKFLNVNGHVCLASALCWGVMSLILTRGVHFYLSEAVCAIPQPYAGLGGAGDYPGVYRGFCYVFYRRFSSAGIPGPERTDPGRAAEASG